MGEISRSKLLIFRSPGPRASFLRVWRWCRCWSCCLICRTPKLITSSLAIYLLPSSIYNRTKVQMEESTVLLPAVTHIFSGKGGKRNRGGQRVYNLLIPMWAALYNLLDMATEIDKIYESLTSSSMLFPKYDSYVLNNS